MRDMSPTLFLLLAVVAVAQANQHDHLTQHLRTTNVTKP